MSIYSSSKSSSYPPPPPPSPPSSWMPATLTPPYSYHLLITHAPLHRAASRHISKICLVAMYRATVFCLLEMYISISSKPTSLIASSNGRYFHIPSSRRRCCFSIIHYATRWWNPPRVLQMRGGVFVGYGEDLSQLAKESYHCQGMAVRPKGTFSPWSYFLLRQPLTFSFRSPQADISGGVVSVEIHPG